MERILDWRSQRPLNVQKLLHILQNGVWSDCTIIVSSDKHEKSFRCHQLVLSMLSPVFETIFIRSGEANPVVRIEDKRISLIAFDKMLLFVYTEKLQLNSFIEARDVCYIASKYEIEELVRLGATSLHSLLTPPDAAIALEFALQVPHPQLEYAAKNMLREHTMEFLRHPNALSATQGSWEFLVTQDALQLNSERTLFDVALNWAKAEKKRRAEEEEEEEKKKLLLQREGDDAMRAWWSGAGVEMCGDTKKRGECELLRDVMLPLLPHIRFLAMTAEEFAEGPADCQLFSTEESLALLKRICAPKAAFPLPPPFSKRGARHLLTK